MRLGIQELRLGRQVLKAAEARRTQKSVVQVGVLHTEAETAADAEDMEEDRRNGFEHRKVLLVDEVASAGDRTGLEGGNLVCAHEVAADRAYEVEKEG